MLSTTESDRAEDQFHAVVRAEAAPYVEFPPTPGWYPPPIGAWAAAMVGTFGWWREDAAPFAAALAILVLAEVAFVRSYFIGLVPVVALVAAACWWGGATPGAVAAFVAVTAGLWVDERAYAAAAGATRVRLA